MKTIKLIILLCTLLTPFASNAQWLGVEMRLVDKSSMYVYLTTNQRFKFGNGSMQILEGGQLVASLDLADVESWVYSTSTLGINDTRLDKQLQLSFASESVTISGFDGEIAVAAYDMSGRLVMDGMVSSGEAIRLSHGAFVLKVGQQSYKIRL